MFTDEQMEWQTHYAFVAADFQTARLLGRWLVRQIRASRSSLSSAVASARRRLYTRRSEQMRAGWAAAENAELS